MLDDDRLFDVDAEAPLAAPTPTLPRHLSPSSASTFEQCPRRWRHRYVERLPDPPGEPALAGTLAHRVLELLLAEPASGRTTERARVLASEAWPGVASHPDYVRLAHDQAATRAFKWRVWRAIEGLWHLEDPASVDVVATEQRIEVELGDVPFVGIVDRLDRSDGELTVSDYKSGRPPSPRHQDERLHQVLLYAAAVAAHTGERPRRARLLYLGATSLEVEVDAANLDAATERLGEQWTALGEATRTDEFEARPGPLCGWCPFAGQCPEGMAEVRQRYDTGRIRASAPALSLVA
ncbi:MAG: PD-(D/E)XK nuclease family protein [Actinomycetota bacterium]|nr:PD-(D/E)XK nuclease family protein [Actinomycetota bacterium]